MTAIIPLRVEEDVRYFLIERIMISPLSHRQQKIFWLLRVRPH